MLAVVDMNQIVRREDDYYRRREKSDLPTQKEKSDSQNHGWAANSVQPFS
jgi:hypothetical protein